MIVGPALLFCPADRPERFEKAAAAGDTVILDLEDAVSLDAKDSARASVIASALDPARTMIRVNPSSTGLLEDDLAAVRGTAYRTLMLPKAETIAELEALSDFDVVAICESPLGVRDADRLAGAPNLIALTWGPEDLLAALGGSSSHFEDGRYREYARYARSRVLIAAASEGKDAFDTVHFDIHDDEGQRDEATDAAASGFRGVMCLHPRQVSIIREAFAPTAEMVEWARGVLAAADSTANGVFTYAGRMIDEPLLRQARRVLQSHLTETD